MSNCTCKNCGHSHHCGRECQECANDVCVKCDCDCDWCNTVEAKTEEEWKWVDSGVEVGF